MKLETGTLESIFANTDKDSLVRFLTDFCPLLDAWFEGGFLSKGVKYSAKNIEFSALNQDFQYLLQWLVAFRNCGIVELQYPLFFAYRDKKGSRVGTKKKWSYPHSELTTWVPDAISAIGGTENQGSYTTTNLIQCSNMPKSVLLMDPIVLLAVLKWLKANKTALFKQAAMPAKQAITLKPKFTLLLKNLIGNVGRKRYFLIYLHRTKIDITVNGSYNAAGG